MPVWLCWSNSWERSYEKALGWITELSSEVNLCKVSAVSQKGKSICKTCKLLTFQVKLDLGVLSTSLITAYMSLVLFHTSKSSVVVTINCCLNSNPTIDTVF